MISINDYLDIILKDFEENAYRLNTAGYKM